MPLNSKAQTETKVKTGEYFQLFVFFPIEYFILFNLCFKSIQMYFYHVKENSLHQINKSKDIMVFFETQFMGPKIFQKADFALF